MKRLLLAILVLSATLTASAQIDDNYNPSDNGFNQMDEDGRVSRRGNGTDSLGSDKEIPKGIYVWTVDRRFGDRRSAEPDTLSHMFMNTIFTSGLRGEYNTTGNLGAPREARIFIDRPQNREEFIFIRPFSYFITQPDEWHFTNTLSPFTNLSYNNCGNRTNGEDHFTAKFGVNAGKRIGVGFKFDYLYGRGYYNSQSTSLFDYTLYGSYLGDRYEAHLLASTNHQKMAENGGVTNDEYILHPEAFNESFETTEIPTMLSQNWNRNDNQHVFFSHRYNVGYNRKVPMTPEEIKARKFAMASRKEADAAKAREKAQRQARRDGRELTDEELEQAGQTQTFAGRPDGARVAEGAARSDSTAASQRIKVGSKAVADSIIAAADKAKEDTSWVKNEYVPVTSFIHTLELNNYRRVYQAYQTPENYYLNTYNVAEELGTDSIYDKTSHWSLRNTFAISLLEGFNKWAKAGLKVFASHELRHYALPDSAGTRTWNEHAVSVGGQLSKTQGRTLHYNVVGEFGVAGISAGELHVDGGIDLNLPLLRDTITLYASGFYHHERPAFYYRHYQSRHFWWDDQDLKFTDHLHLQGQIAYPKTGTTLRAAYDIIHNHTYLSTAYTAQDNSRLGNQVGVKQSSDAISIFTAQVGEDLAFGPLHWESLVTLQKSTSESVLPLPLINAYTNLYLRFKIARVLKCDFGADARYFTKYEAPEYVPGLGQFAVQGNESKVEVGNYPIVNVYANFHLKQTRFFIMYSHANAGSGKRAYFFVPHYPLNGSVLRFGLSWNFFN